mmetsp:Transcript_121552/g.271569  ORF Transcript_121552/g.271569 Transcript_121552/m.271569 type:complete len:115 (-) Transcript_121552:56-400(-)
MAQLNNAQLCWNGTGAMQQQGQSPQPIVMGTVVGTPVTVVGAAQPGVGTAVQHTQYATAQPAPSRSWWDQSEVELCGARPTRRVVIPLASVFFLGISALAGWWMFAGREEHTKE